MRIAMIGEDILFPANVRSTIDNKIKEKGWQIDRYENVNKFVSENNDYDVVLIDQAVEYKNKNYLSDKFLGKDTDVAILNGTSSLGSDRRLVHNTQINALIDKNDPEDILSWLNYVDVKHRLTHRIKKDSGIYSEIVSNTNGCTFDIKDGVSVLGISRLMTPNRIDTITKSIEATNNKVVIYFSDEVKEITSKYFGLILTFWEKIVKERKGKMTFWLKDKEDDVIHKANSFCINELFPCFIELDDAIRYLKLAEYNDIRKKKNEHIKSKITQYS